MNRGNKRPYYESYDTLPGCSTDRTKGGTSKNDLVCDLCEIELPNENSMRQHILGESHRNIEVAEERKRVQNKCGIRVSGYPPFVTQDVLLNYFSKYGKIVWVNFGHKYALLDYSEPRAVQNLMNREHFLKGKRVMVNYRKFKNKKEERFTKANVEESTDCESPIDIEKIKDVPKFDDQLQALIQQLQPNVEEQFLKYNKICADLHEILSHMFPQCNIQLFGSAITGLNFINSNMDVYISGIKQEGKDKPYLNRTKKILLDTQRFSNAFLKARKEIHKLECVHVETGITCSIDLSNALCVCNSQLIKYYINIDPKVKNLMMFLKYWAKKYQFTGQGHLFSNYAFCLLLIFFLQQEPYNVPSVSLLQQNPATDSQRSWRSEFQEIPVNATSLTNTPSVKLLENFFSFYADFEYRMNVICPFLGRALKKDQFENPETLPDCFDPYKAYLEFGIPLKVQATICVQDPFEHCQNTTPIASSALLERFVQSCRLAKKLCGNGENALLYNLLTMTPPYKKTELIIKPDFCQFSVQMKPNLRYIERKIDNTSNRDEAIHEAWFKSVVEFTIIVLKNFLKFELTEKCDPTKAKNTKCEEQSDVHDKRKTRLCYQCVGKVNLWEGRKLESKVHTFKKISKRTSIIHRELAITDQLDKCYKNIPQSSTIINFEITLDDNLAPPEMAVRIKRISAFKNSFKSFSIFLSENLRNWFDIYVNELNQ